MAGVREQANQMEMPEIPKRWDKWTVFFIFFHSFFCAFSLLWPTSDGQPNWLGFGINFLFVALNVFKFYMKWKASLYIERLVKHAEALKRAINTPIYVHDKDNQNITITFIQVMSPDQADELKRKIKHARSQRSRRI
jgi:hypothetical protein